MAMCKGFSRAFYENTQKVVRKTVAEKKPWKQELNLFLRNYRATPHSSTNVPPATLLFPHPIRTRLPEIPHMSSDSTVHTTAQTNDKKAKKRMQLNFNRKETTRKHMFGIGDLVLVRVDGHVGKGKTPYKPKPYKVTSVKGSMVSTSRNGRMVTRHASHFKLFTGMDVDTDSELDDVFVTTPPDQGTSFMMILDLQNEDLISGISSEISVLFNPRWGGM
ncbi:hypothetical protein HOLleu_03715 [Holothuria leucospilota]|uniref:Uncharacterized protein n=1 Tax=Holothuria leucospilota TaxID=206669 RepID=A0A9Q1HLH3_HOLLE|nr:hypothetical protein HOLleu_03715 [Holothuria leucospilota]